METTYLISQLGFAGTTVFFYWLLLARLKKSLLLTDFSDAKKRNIFRGTVLTLIAWATLTTMLSLSGYLTDFSTRPPRFVIILLIPLIGIILVIRTDTMNTIIRHTPPAFITGLQSFRIIVELLLLLVFTIDLAPVQMTFEGRNLDILSGITAPVIAYLQVNKKITRTWTVIWNLVCLGLLINVVVIAILSLPTPFRVFTDEPSTSIVTRFPFIWLPAFLVPLAYGLHFLSLRGLFIKNDSYSIV